MDFKFPDVGEGVEEGVLVKWLVKEGDSVKADQAVCEMETDKAVVEIPCPKAGKITKLFFREKDTVKVGSVLLSLDEGGAGASPAVVTPGPAAKKVPQTAAELPVANRAPLPTIAAALAADKKTDYSSSVTVSGTASSVQKQASDRTLEIKRVLATPHTRQLARDLNVDIAQVVGSGSGGRITDDDVRRFSQTGRSERAVVVEKQEVVKTAPVVAGQSDRVPYKGIRKAIGERMRQSVSMAVHTPILDECDVSALWNLRAREKEALSKEGVKLTFLPFIIKAITVALKKHPILNSSLDETSAEIVLKKYYHIGFAVDTPDGLLVPVLQNTDRKSIRQLAREIEELSALARERKLSAEQMSHATFSVTNYGSIGGLFSMPIINYPNAGILGIGRIVEKPVVRDGQIVSARVLALSLSFDHRVLDGGEACRFLNEIMSHLSDPNLLLIDGM